MVPSVILTTGPSRERMVPFGKQTNMFCSTFHSAGFPISLSSNKQHHHHQQQAFVVSTQESLLCSVLFLLFLHWQQQLLLVIRIIIILIILTNHIIPGSHHGLDQRNESIVAITRKTHNRLPGIVHGRLDMNIIIIIFDLLIANRYGFDFVEWNLKWMDENGLRSSERSRDERDDCVLEKTCRMKHLDTARNEGYCCLVKM
jgi:hypothetical protein